MKYCLSARQPVSVLKQADEIMVEFRDYRIISDFFADYPDKVIILDIPVDKMNVEIEPILKAYTEASDNFVCRLSSVRPEATRFFKENDIKFYYAYPVDNYYDLKALDDLGVEYARIAPPLTHDMKHTGYFGCQIRAVPNVAYDAYIPRENGIIGGWIRPEDVEYYEEGIDVFEFEGGLNLEQEKTMFEIYSQKKEWKGNLNILITNLNENVTSVGLPDEFGQIRATCRQRCTRNGTCHYCESAFRLANALETYLKRKAD